MGLEYRSPFQHHSVTRLSGSVSVMPLCNSQLANSLGTAQPAPGSLGSPPAHLGENPRGAGVPPSAALTARISRCSTVSE